MGYFCWVMVVAMLKAIGTIILAMAFVAILMITVANMPTDARRGNELYKFTDMDSDNPGNIYMVEER